MVKTITLTATKLPKHLQAWHVKKALQEGGSSQSHICTALYNNNLLTRDELDTFNKLTFWGLKNRETFTTFYRNYFGKIMDKWSEKASPRDWIGLKQWAHTELNLINKNCLEKAFIKFIEKVVEINTKVNYTLELYTAPELDCYLEAIDTIAVKT